MMIPLNRTGVVLSVSYSEDDHSLLRDFLAPKGWRLCEARTLRETRPLLRQDQASVVVCEARLPDAAWQEVLWASGQAAQPPSLIVTSRMADERLWAEVLNLGGYDVLAKPFHSGEVQRVVEAAHFASAWARTRSCALPACRRITGAA